MKILMILILIFIFLVSTLVAQNQYPVNWVKYKYMDPGSDVTRGLCYNKKTDHVLVATRKWGNDVFILEAATGDSIGKLNTSIISGGTYALNLVSAADDGTIYVCNLSAPQFTPGSTFKIYRYVNETAGPELVYDDASGGDRYGDALAAIGSGINKYIYSSGKGNDKILVLRDEGLSSLYVDSYITLPQPGNARHGISPVSPGGQLWINGADDGYPPPRLITNTGTVITTVPDSIFSAGGTSTILHMILGKYNVLTTTNAYPITFKSCQYFVDELGTVTFDYFGMDSDSLPLIYNGSVNNNNTNATSVLAYDSKRHAILSLFGYNSIASSTMDSLLKASTPRSGNLEINVDGENDFFPTDHVGESNEREMYLTWSEGKVFVGITGHTLIDPTLTNYLYVAFDLDPTGNLGTNLPPTSDGGVNALPFKADVVYRVEPYNQPDYMIGSIFKWNGASWDEFLFDGNLASQGALAFADEGPRKLAEIAAVRNTAGIGLNYTDISLMVYLAEGGSNGAVLCAFPDDNPLGNGVSFNYYYYADVLGEGMYPTDTNYVHIKSQITAIENKKEILPDNFSISQNYPNPFNPQTTIEYYLPQAADVQLVIYDISGSQVDVIVNKHQPAGKKQVTWQAHQQASGVYFFKLVVDQKPLATRKMILLK